MLTGLKIENIAIIDKLDVEFDNGLNILTGETGAGKSILIDSISFVLGKRADKSLIRFGEEKATVCAYFDIENCEKTKEILSNFDIETENELILKRIMTLDGKNTCSINGEKVTLNMLRDIALSLVNIYGQHESSQVLDADNHLSILDNFAQAQLKELLAKQAELYSQFKILKKKLAEYGNFAQLEKNKDLLKFQIDEIEDAEIEVGEEEKLVLLRNKMNNSQDLVVALSNTFDLLNGSDENIISMLNMASSELEKIVEFDQAIDENIARLDSAKIELKDIAEFVENLAGECEFDQGELDRCEDRIAVIRKLKKKYGNSEEEILEYLEKTKEKYDFLCDGENNIAKLEKEIDASATVLLQNSEQITGVRKQKALELSGKLEKELKELGIVNAQFVVEFNSVTSKEDELSLVNELGCDRVKFLFTANKGQPPRELEKIISGGELSRFMLAFKNIIANLDGIDTMIFDEIDSGVSGQTAQIVAQKIYNISKNKQVFIITHLAQMAAFADNHYKIAKTDIAEKTVTRLITLDKESSIGELARLVDGNENSTFALPHAKELKAFADNFKTK
ncbi:MAG: DNA repair protein RecN [Clostridia bacterium]